MTSASDRPDRATRPVVVPSTGATHAAPSPNEVSMSPSHQPTATPATGSTGARLRDELARARARCRDLERQHEELLSDPGVIQEDRDASAQLLGAARAAVAAAALAVDRWEEGGYGRCESCGARIPRERLDAVPDAVRCVGCTG